jgi:malonate decarboxylase epsilon subunit
MELGQPRAIYVGNVKARALRVASAIAEDLAANIAHPVRWYDATTVLAELGCRLFLEMPPGHVLSDLAREAFCEVRTLALGQSTLKGALHLAARLK